jgi:hypothetical protein
VSSIPTEAELDFVERLAQNDREETSRQAQALLEAARKRLELLAEQDGSAAKGTKVYRIMRNYGRLVSKAVVPDAPMVARMEASVVSEARVITDEHVQSAAASPAEMEKGKTAK